MTPEDEAKARLLPVPILIPPRGMAAPRIEMRPVGWWEAEREETLRKEAADAKAKKKAAEAKKRQARALRSRAQVQAMDAQANRDAAAFQRLYLQQAARGF